MSFIDVFISERVRNNEHVQIFLLSGICLKGFVHEYDDECINLNNNTLIMRTAIGSIKNDDTRSEGNR